MISPLASPETEGGRLALAAAPYFFGSGLRDTHADLWLRGLKLDPRSLQLRGVEARHGPRGGSGRLAAWLVLDLAVAGAIMLLPWW